MFSGDGNHGIKLEEEIGSSFGKERKRVNSQTSEDALDHLELTSHVTPMLSSSAPELSGEWHEVRRRERKAQKEREEREKVAKEDKDSQVEDSEPIHFKMPNLLLSY